jgi:hypothetical protein
MPISFNVSEISVGGVGIVSSVFATFQSSPKNLDGSKLTFIQKERPKPAKVVLGNMQHLDSVNRIMLMEPLTPS